MKSVWDCTRLQMFTTESGNTIALLSINASQWNWKPNFQFPALKCLYKIDCLSNQNAIEDFLSKCNRWEWPLWLRYQNDWRGRPTSGKSMCGGWSLGLSGHLQPNYSGCLWVPLSHYPSPQHCSGAWSSYQLHSLPQKCQSLLHKKALHRLMPG